MSICGTIRLAGVIRLNEPRPERPGFPPSYGVRGGTLPWSHAASRLEAARNYWLGTTCLDGRPHAAPVWGVWLDGALYFATDPTSRKGRNLAAQPAAVLHLESGDDVVILECRAEPVTDVGALERFADAYEAKYGIRPGDAGVFRLRPQTAYAWLEASYPETATRWRIATE